MKNISWILGMLTLVTSCGEQTREQNTTVELAIADSDQISDGFNLL